MNFQTYKGSAELLDKDDTVVVAAQCSYRQTQDSRSGLKDWGGRLSRLEPEFGLVGGAYKLRLPDGRIGSIIVTNVSYSSSQPTNARFLGSGPVPGEGEE